MSDEKNAQVPENLKITHDGYFRETFQVKRLAKAFLRKVLPAETLAVLDLEGLIIEDRHLTDDLFTSVNADMVYRVPIPGADAYVNFFVVIEHKSRPDDLTIYQLWGYVYRICHQNVQAAEKRSLIRAGYQLPPVVAIIVHHGKSKFQGKTELAELFMPLPGLKPFLPKLQAILFDLNLIADDDPVLSDPAAPELKVALTVLKAVFRQDVAVTVNDVVRALKPVSDDPVMRRIIRATWVYLMNSARYLKNNMEPLLETFQSVVGGNIMQTMAEVWKAEGKTEGKAEGEVKGRMEGILAFLEARFGSVPGPVRNAVITCTDPAKLNDFTRLAATCDSMDEFQQGLLQV
ncbi:Rpn family recombination-promoting nuclease/putative transposase [Desulfosarcina sp. OttesenSCG-928-B08]|nr:Rpn family recombination-promoting nuclease/putative transposase [Desulfosarcina sp. OttesenSCG-928-B08]